MCKENYLEIQKGVDTVKSIENSIANDNDCNNKITNNHKETLFNVNCEGSGRLFFLARG